MNRARIGLAPPRWEFAIQAFKDRAMPLPKPEDNERRADFVQRCMRSEVMREEFPDGEQRLAVCERQFNRRMNDGIRAAAGREARKE